MQGPMGIVLILLVVSVVFVNGWTDAPNAIANVVTTKALSYRNAVWLAAVCNLLGIVVMSLLNASVAQTVTSVIDLGNIPTDKAAAALCAAMASIVIFAVAAWLFGIPTSESHALIAALTGSSVALSGWSGVNGPAWGKVLAGLASSLLLGFSLGYMITRLLAPALTRIKASWLDRFQVLSAAGMAFMHGAQDGQKFISVFLLADMLAKGGVSASNRMGDHLLLLALTAVVMALGTGVGGKRIIYSVGEKMVAIEKYQGVCADLGSILCLLAASLTGVPMSTTHTKTTAIMGAGKAGKKGGLDLHVVGGMLLAWAVTFPVCGAIGFVVTSYLTR